MKKTLFLDICRENYLALIQMIDQAITLCPDKLWGDSTHQPQFWQEIYHTIYYLDFYFGNNPRKHPERLKGRTSWNQSHSQESLQRRGL